jgi:lipopolysaccharide export system protein LptC
MTKGDILTLPKRKLARRPGGPYDWFVRLMKEALPAASIALMMTLIIWPLINTREFSFLIAKDTVAVSEERMRLEQPVYRGLDSRNRPFEITARRAVQKSSANPTVVLEGIAARITTQEGITQVTAAQGSYNLDTEKLRINGPVDFGTAEGYKLTAGDVEVDVPTRMVRSVTPVTGTGPLGRFSAQGFSVDINGEIARFTGGVKLRIEQR